MNFDLPVTGHEHCPVFADAKQCRDWLPKVPLANPAQAQAMLLRQLNLLHRFSLPPEERFAILEVLRGPVASVQEDAARAFAARPLPLDPAEQAMLESTLGLWHILALGYQRCFAALCGRDEGAGAPPFALLAQRALSVFADWQVDVCRGGQLPDADYWRKLNQIFGAAEALGIATEPVADPVRHGKAPTTALAMFAECNLLSCASPYELPARHLAWIARWARRWGAKPILLKAPPEDIRNRAVPLWVDLESDQPAGYAPRPASGGRWLDTTELKQSLVARIAKLEQGRAPAELQLGDDVTQPAAGQLLQRVLQRWCGGGEARRHDRRAASGEAQLMVGFDVVHYHLSGHKAFHAPSRDDVTLRREREEFETFGGRRHSRDDGRARQGAPLENWQVMDDWRVVNESAAGLRIVRPLSRGVRVGAGLLVAIKVGEAPRFTLACVRWALRGGEESLVSGIQLFPGVPCPAAARILDAGATTAPWRQAIVLPEVLALREPESLVLRAGSFRLDRRVEVMVEQQSRVLVLDRILDRGLEFERCTVRPEN